MRIGTPPPACLRKNRNLLSIKRLSPATPVTFIGHAGDFRLARRLRTASQRDWLAGFK